MLQMKPGALSSKRNLEVEYRDLKLSNEQLHKEIERKDARNDKLTKEIMASRTTVSNYERDLKIVTGNLERINSDRIRLQTELKTQKDYIQKLENQITKYRDSESMVKHISDQESMIRNLNKEVVNCKSAMDNYENRLRQLDYDNDVLRKSIEVQVQYESGLKGVNNGREIMRSLYQELGKKQADLHKVSITLAEFEDQNSQLRREIESLREIKINSQSEIENLKSQIQYLSNEVEDLQNETQNYKRQVSGLQNTISLSQQDVDELNRKFVEQKRVFESDIASKNHAIAELMDSQSSNQKDHALLRKKYEGLQESFKHLESAHELTIQRFQAEKEKLTAELKMIHHSKQELEQLPEEIEEMRDQIQTLLVEKQNIQVQLEESKQKMKDLNDQNFDERIKVLSEEVDHHKQVAYQHLKERDEAVQALQQMMMATRELTERFSQEREEKQRLERKIIQLENSMDGLRRAKEHISTAVLDALHKERLKVISLEKTIQELPFEKRFPHLIRNSTDMEGNPLSMSINNQTPMKLALNDQLSSADLYSSPFNSMNLLHNSSNSNSEMKSSQGGLLSINGGDQGNSSRNQYGSGMAFISNENKNTNSYNSNDVKNLKESQSYSENRTQPEAGVDPKSNILDELKKLRETLSRIQDRPQESSASGTENTVRSEASEQPNNNTNSIPFNSERNVTVKLDSTWKRNSREEEQERQQPRSQLQSQPQLSPKLQPTERSNHLQKIPNLSDQYDDSQDDIEDPFQEGGDILSPNASFVVDSRLDMSNISHL